MMSRYAAWTRTRGFRWAVRLLVWPLLLYVTFRWFEHHQVYHPSRRLDANGAELGVPWEDVVFRSADGTKLNGWFFSSAAQRTDEFAVVFCHGNAGNVSHRLDACRALLGVGVSVFVFDYRGYGQSAGRPSEEGTYQDAVAAYDWLRNKGFEPNRIVPLGESLGGAVAAELVLRRPAAGLILVSAFTSIPDVGAELFPWLPVRWLCAIRYSTVTKLPRVKVPVLIMHGRADTIIPFRHGEALYAAASAPKMLRELRGDHNDSLFVGFEEYQEGLRIFIKSLRPASDASREGFRVPSPGTFAE